MAFVKQWERAVGRTQANLAIAKAAEDCIQPFSHNTSKERELEIPTAGRRYSPPSVLSPLKTGS